MLQFRDKIHGCPKRHLDSNLSIGAMNIAMNLGCNWLERDGRTQSVFHIRTN